MNQQGGYEGFSPAAYGAPAPYQPPAPAGNAPALRPLSTGEVLDRTFVLYRSRFWLFAAIAMLPAALLTLSSMVRLIFLRTSQTPVATQSTVPADVLAKAMSNALLMQAYFLPATLLFVVAYGVSHAATAHAVLQMTHDVSITAGSAYRAVRGLWLRWVGIAIRQFWAGLWPMLPGFALFAGAVFTIPKARAGGFALTALLVFLAVVFIAGGVVLGAINFLRVAIAVPAGVQEGLGVNAALRRSRVLVSGRKGRIFLLLLLVYVLQMVAGVVQVPFVFLALRAHGAQEFLLVAIELLIGFVAATLVSPVASIALCLFYVDERVRREGYDIEVLMQHNLGSAGAGAAQPLI